MTLPPSTAIAPKLKIPPTVTSTLIPTIPPTTTSTLIMTTQPTATLPLTPTIPLTATLTQIPTMPPTTTLPHIQTTTLTLPPRALTTTLPPTTTIPPSLRPTTIPTPKHLHQCNKPINTLTRTSTVSPKPNPPVRTPPTTTMPPIQTQNSTLPTDNITLNNLTTLFTNFLSLFILLLIPFTLLCLTNNVDFNVELRDCGKSFSYRKRNLYITNIFNYTRLNFKVFNSSIGNIIHPLPIPGIAYKLDGDFPSKNLTHKIHCKSGPEAHTIKLAFFPLLFLFIVTISNWIRKETFSYYTSIKHKYLFLKSQRHFHKHDTLFIFQKVLLFLLVVLTFDAKLPSRTQNDLNTAIVKDNEFSRFNTLLQPT